MPVIDGRRPDIYYVLLDEYARHDALGGFDNTDFVRELERRGFYVAAQATSNYWKSLLSIPSILNMSYLSDLGSRSPGQRERHSGYLEKSLIGGDCEECRIYLCTFGVRACCEQ